MSFQIAIAPNRRAAARFIGKVRRRLIKALADNPDVKRTDIAEALNIHRSVITKQLKGSQDMSLSRVAEIAWALGYEANFDLLRPEKRDRANSVQTISVPASVGKVKELPSKTAGFVRSHNNIKIEEFVS